MTHAEIQALLEAGVGYDVYNSLFSAVLAEAITTTSELPQQFQDWQLVQNPDGFPTFCTLSALGKTGKLNLVNIIVQQGRVIVRQALIRYSDREADHLLVDTENYHFSDTPIALEQPAVAAKKKKKRTVVTQDNVDQITASFSVYLLNHALIASLYPGLELKDDDEEEN